jgi:hypothetical protein
MDKIVTWIKLTWVTFINAPVIAPLLDLLSHRSVLVLLAGFVGYTLVPQIQGLPPMWRDNLGNFIFIGTLLVSGRFTLEGIMTARAGLPQTMEGYLRALLTELISPTPDATVSVGGTSAIVSSQWQQPVSTRIISGSANATIVPPRPTLPPDQIAEHG